MSGISSRVVELATKYGIVPSHNSSYMERLEQFANEVYYDGLKAGRNDPAIKAANEIADSFKAGFCDDRMVKNFADIIRKHIK